MNANKCEARGVTEPLSYRRATHFHKLVKMGVMLLSLLLITAHVRAQSALDGFDPNVNGSIYVVVVQPDGKILIGGNFTSVSPNGGTAVTRNRMARLNADGTLDTAFNANANSDVEAIAVQSDGKILVTGSFTSIGGQSRNRIARLDATTGLADSFNPNADHTVYAIAVQSDGKILAGGDFTSIGGQPRQYLARLDATSGLADSFDPHVSDDVYAIVVQPDGKILIGGVFGNINGATRNRIARLDATTGLADSFDPNALNGDVDAIALQADGKILAAGGFTGIGGATRHRIARLEATTGLADSFNPNASAYIFSVAVQPDGKILAGGFFSSIGGATRNRIARLDAATGLSDSFNPSANNAVYAIAVQMDGKIVAGGDFSALAPNGGATVTRNRIARMETDGRLDQTLDLNITVPPGGGGVYVTAVQSDGKILIAGLFESVLGVARTSIARLNSDGTLDTIFAPHLDAGYYVEALAVQADGKILAGGNFLNIGGQPRNGIARLDATTGLADSFNANANSSVLSVAIQADGKIVVGGTFQGLGGQNSIGGQPRNFIARLDPVTGLADSFNPNPNNTVYSIVVQADGKVLAGGHFNSVGGQTRNRIARLDATTSLADLFNPNAGGPDPGGVAVNIIAVQPDGKVLAGGYFNSIGGQTRNGLARLDATTGLADAWDPNASGNISFYSIAVQADGKILTSGLFGHIGGQPHNYVARLDGTTGLADSFDPNANNPVYSIVLQPDGKVLAGGNFNSIGGQARNLFARLSNTTAALQSLDVTQTSITWVRGGSSPQFTRVTFEFSDDNVNYAPLGHGTAAGNNWSLTGLNLPTGENIYVRARGYFGNGGTAESITESVRNAFLAGSPPTPTPTATPAPPTPTPTTTPTPGPTPTPSPTGTPCNATFSENFDTLTPPALPPGWIASNAGGDALWATSGTTPDSAPNDAFIDDQPGVSDKYLYTPPITIGPASAVIRFRNSFDTEAGGGMFWDGGVLEVSSPNIAGGAFLDITNPAIGSFISGGYTGVIATFASNPLGGRMAWSGNSGGYIDTVINLGTNLSGRTITLRFRMGTDEAVGAPGWRIDSFSVMDTSCLTPTPTPTPSPTPTPTPVLTPTPTPSPSPSPTPPVTVLGNISTRVQVGTGDNAMIGGFIITGTQPKTVIVRGMGPSLNGVPGTLADPVIEVHGSSGELVATNDNWKDAETRRQIIAYGLAPSNDLESALWGIINPGAYTVVVRGKNNATGIGLFEVYDLDQTVDSKLANVSTRGLVQTGNGVMIAGIIVLGQAPQRVIVRALGPSLPVPGPLANPTLELRDGNGSLIRSNDNWRSDQEAEIMATGIPPTNDLESAIVQILPANGVGYTAIVRGANATTGVALVEVYALN